MPAVAQTVRHYRILDRLGAGGMGIVYKAEDTKLGRTVALKFLPPALTSDEASKQRFLVEARAASKLDHPNICTVYEIGEDDDGQLFIAMAYYEGETLAQKIARGQVPVAESIAIVHQIADGLAAAHAAGIVHRDIKPANVIVTTSGIVKIVDFGLAKLIDVSTTRTRASVGTAAYMAPEQIRVEDITPATDIWSLGVLFFELLARVRPFRGDSEQAVLYSILNDTPPALQACAPDISLQLEQVIRRMLAKEPSARYGSVQEFLADLTPTASYDAPADAEPRFTPGSIIGNRFRVVSLLGEGGMGQVYRADDLKLGQKVALKYIPRTLTDDASVFERVCGEVRLGRQLSHPNICRIFDIVDVGKHHFIAMEFIDGEDLASLLRRIGRLPPDKALALTRDIASGLAAAHDRGIVHRDLKPANIMVDGEGRARITDFGIAALAATLDGQREFAGTPAYMAREQIERGEATARSDIYALGLIMFEMFTGRQVFDAGTVEEIRQQHDTSRKRVASLARTIDPVVERIVAKCTEENSEQRFSSVHAVIAALPGGDAMTAAIAAGETPSPEMVASASAAGDLEVSRAWLLLSASIVSVLLCAWLSRWTTLTGYVPDIRSRDALTIRTREATQAFGHAPPRFVRLVDYYTNDSYLGFLAAHRDWAKLQTSPPSPYRCIVRTSPIRFVPVNRWGQLQLGDPSESIPGMSTIEFDHEGRVVSYKRVPEQSGAAAAPDWSRIFAQADLDLSRFKEVAPQWTPPYGFDQRYAWIGSHAASPAVNLRIEAATLRGRVVYFQVIEPWTLPPRVPVQRLTPSDAIALMVLTASVFLAILARRNVVRGRADTRGAMRLVVFIGLVRFIGEASAAVPVVSPNAMFVLSVRLVGAAMFFGAFTGIAYLGVEPYVRRRWPRILISLSRVLRGQLRDPMFGRDILIGTTVGVTLLAFYKVMCLALDGIGWSAERPRDVLTYVATHFLLGITQPFMLAATWSLGWVGILVLLRFAMRRDWIAVVGLTILLSIPGLMNPSPADKIIAVAFASSAVWCLWRYGVLAAASAVYMRGVLASAPLTLDFSTWFAPQSTAAMAIVVAIAAFGFYLSLAGKPALGGILQDEPV